ncbi:DUF2164 domain-containing protein [Caldisalinibacter kiritimatiensis]|uniref:DUF2164 domain-containing protein n=1 Tax=Caldisalinibacter kiritimatiensis TaxID=1304284 RepID=R1CGR2_9FIRM|nr:DUF2164 domain-containing protein [Caldisalinibacter kiritimatiensis]EOD01475.1 hypothetical protein L21TH_0458 [Caldisalinibacter kiritimatiensis]
MILKLSKHEKEMLISEIQKFFYEEHDKEIGIIAAEKVLDFFLENLGSVVYNKALDNAKIWFESKMEDIEFDYDLLYKDVNKL